MLRKNIFYVAALAGMLFAGRNAAQAQDIHFTQFSASPLTLNPAFTGNFDGRLRAAAVYRNQWQSVTIPFVTYSASVDAPIVHDLTIDDYLAAGIQLYNDRAGDGNLNNFSALASVAYHKFLGSGFDGPNKTVSVGLQGGYTSKSVDISKLYFGDEFVNGLYNPGSGREYPYLNNNVHYFIVNAGVAFSHAVSDRFSYVIGLGGNNLNQPSESLLKKPNSDVGLGLRFTGQVGAIINVSDKFSLRPAALYQTQATATEIIAGNEFHYIVGNPEIRSFANAIYLGVYYRNSDAIMGVIGFDIKSFRFGVSYDYNISSLNQASNGRGGYELSLRYILPNPLDFARRITYPCSRF